MILRHVFFHMVKGLLSDISIPVSLDNRRYIWYTKTKTKKEGQLYAKGYFSDRRRQARYR